MVASIYEFLRILAKHAFGVLINSSQLVKMKKYRFLTCPCNKTYRVEAVGLKNSNYTFKNYDFRKYVKFGAISGKFDILSISASLQFESKNPFEHNMTHIISIICRTPHFVFSDKYRFLFIILRVFLTVKSPSLTQRSVSQENAFKKSKYPSPYFFSQEYRLK